MITWLAVVIAITGCGCRAAQGEDSDDSGLGGCWDAEDIPRCADYFSSPCDDTDCVTVLCDDPFGVSCASDMVSGSSIQVDFFLAECANRNGIGARSDLTCGDTGEVARQVVLVGCEPNYCD